MGSAGVVAAVGWDSLLLQAIAEGAAGVMAGTANVMSAWTEEAHRLLAANSPLPHEAAPDLPRLRDSLLTWSTTWTPAAAPFTRVAPPRPAYDIPAIDGLGKRPFPGWPWSW
ncbi:hypothetical protein [Streptomyces sp. NPDC057301]|uniref:hypothetical protein n=1 Tax=Streptomyces sp. NPDC057301 TaxID=3346093 RepID=UPI00362A5F5F